MTRELRIVSQGNRTLGKEQQAFNGLLSQLQGLRDELAQWRALEERHHQQVMSRLAPLQAEIQAARCNLILLCDDILGGRRGGGVSGKAERRQLVAFVLDLCMAHLETRHDDAIVAVHDRYASIRFADIQPAERAKARGFTQDPSGAASPEAPPTASSVETLEAAALEAEAAARAAWEEREAGRRSRRADRAGRRKAEAAVAAELAEKAASQSVREVYRKLAGALHPDRAADEADRARRHALMLRVNQGYEDADLLGLLNLQLEIEQIDAEHLASVSQARLRHYNRILQEQVAELEQELIGITARFRMTMAGMPPVVTQQSVERDLKRHIADVRRELEALQAHARAMLDPGFRRTWLRVEARQGRRDS